MSREARRGHHTPLVPVLVGDVGRLVGLGWPTKDGWHYSTRSHVDAIATKIMVIGMVVALVDDNDKVTLALG